MGFVIFVHPGAELAARVVVLAVDVAFAVVATAGWSGPRGKYGFMALALAWLGYTWTSGVLLAGCC
jgi:hypothetical protein